MSKTCGECFYFVEANPAYSSCECALTVRGTVFATSEACKEFYPLRDKEDEDGKDE